MIMGISLSNGQTVFAQEKTEVVTGTVYQFGKKGKYDIFSADKSYSTNDSIESGGRFSISGDIRSVTEKDGFPVYSINGGRLTFS